MDEIEAYRVVALLQKGGIFEFQMRNDELIPDANEKVLISNRRLSANPYVGCFEMHQTGKGSEKMGEEKWGRKGDIV